MLTTSKRQKLTRQAARYFARVPHTGQPTEPRRPGQHQTWLDRALRADEQRMMQKLKDANRTKAKTKRERL